MIHRLFNLGLRGGGMVGKFLLIFFLARILSPEEVGVYGLFAATVSYALYFLGLDFYTYSGRAMLHAEKTKWPNLLRDQSVLFICSYLVIFPLLSLIFIVELLPIKYALLFYIILTLEHLSQELNRLMVIIGKPLASGVLSFIRSGAWCYALIAIYLIRFVRVDLYFVLLLWILADTLVLIGGIWLLRKLPWSNLTWTVNWTWIYQGLKVASLFFVGTIALRGLFTLDRYFIETFSSREILGVYTLYIGICFSLIGFVDAVVFSFRYPLLFSLYKSEQHAAFKAAKHDFSRQTFLTVSALALTVGLFIVPALKLIGKPIYLEYINVFYLLLTASVIYVMSHIPHYILYATGHDFCIVRAHIIGFILFIIFAMILAPTYQMIGVATALLIAIAVIGVLKQWKIFRWVDQ